MFDHLTIRDLVVDAVRQHCKTQEKVEITPFLPNYPNPDTEWDFEVRVCSVDKHAIGNLVEWLSEQTEVAGFCISRKPIEAQMGYFLYGHRRRDTDGISTQVSTPMRFPTFSKSRNGGQEEYPIAFTLRYRPEQ